MHWCHKTLGDTLVEQVWHLWIVTTSRDTKVAVTYSPFINLFYITVVLLIQKVKVNKWLFPKPIGTKLF